jgi:hypothetical protein
MISAKRDRPTDRRPSWNADASASPEMWVVAKMLHSARRSQSHARPAAETMIWVMISRRWISRRRASFSCWRTLLRSLALAGSDITDLPADANATDVEDGPTP